MRSSVVKVSGEGGFHDLWWSYGGGFYHWKKADMRSMCVYCTGSPVSVCGHAGGLIHRYECCLAGKRFYDQLSGRFFVVNSIIFSRI